MKKDLKKRTSKKEKGITLIALVVTIVIMLILAGVTLNGALGENGLFKKAKGAATTYEREALLEEMRLAILDKQLETGGELSEENLKDVLGKYGEVKEENGKVTGVKPEGKDEITLDEIENGEATSSGGSSSGTSGGSSNEDLTKLMEQLNNLTEKINKVETQDLPELKSEINELKNTDLKNLSDKIDALPKIEKIEVNKTFTGDDTVQTVMDWTIPNCKFYCFSILASGSAGACSEMKIAKTSSPTLNLYRDDGSMITSWKEADFIGNRWSNTSVRIMVKTENRR